MTLPKSCVLKPKLMLTLQGNYDFISTYSFFLDRTNLGFDNLIHLIFFLIFIFYCWYWWELTKLISTFFFSWGCIGQHRGSWLTKKCKCGWTSWSSTSDHWRTVYEVKRIDVSRLKPKLCDCVTPIRGSKANLKQPLNSWSASPIGFSKLSNGPEISSSSIHIYISFFFYSTRPYKRFLRKNNSNKKKIPCFYGHTRITKVWIEFRICFICCWFFFPFFYFFEGGGASVYKALKNNFHNFISL